jgi:hypothetical protein
LEADVERAVGGIHEVGQWRRVLCNAHTDVQTKKNTGGGRGGCSFCLSRDEAKARHRAYAEIPSRQTLSASRNKSVYLLPGAGGALKRLQGVERHHPGRDGRAKVFGPKGPQWHVLPLLDVARGPQNGMNGSSREIQKRKSTEREREKKTSRGDLAADFKAQGQPRGQRQHLRPPTHERPRYFVRTSRS